jgi:cytochrome bd-type quinol oxidase subunit 1
VPVVFWRFGVMVAIGLLMVLFGLVGVWPRWRLFVAAGLEG